MTGRHVHVCISHHFDKTQIQPTQRGKEVFSLQVYSPPLKEAKASTQSKIWKHGGTLLTGLLGGTLLTGLLPGSRLASFSIQFQAHLPRNAWTLLC